VQANGLYPRIAAGKQGQRRWSAHREKRFSDGAEQRIPALTAASIRPRGFVLVVSPVPAGGQFQEPIFFVIQAFPL